MVLDGEKSGEVVFVHCGGGQGDQWRILARQKKRIEPEKKRMCE